MQEQEHPKCPNPSLSNPTTTNAMEEYERKNKRGEHLNSPKSTSNGFSHKRRN
jgi:hypothetical protein